MGICDNLFPLKLSDFEFYMLRDETPEHPMVMVLRIHLEGAVNESAFREALVATLDENPLLRSTVQEQHGVSCWQLSEQTKVPLRVVSCPGEQPPTGCPVVRIDLRQQTGAQFELRRCSGRSVLVCYFHHACVDGLGAIRFLADVFARYGRATAAADEERPTLRVTDPAQLAQRGVIPELRRKGGASVSWSEWLKGPLRFLTGKVFTIRAKNDGFQREAGCDNVLHTAVLPRSLQKQLKRLAASRQVSTNDLCMMAYCQQLAQWTATDGGVRGSDMFRVLMPISTRTVEHDRISAANMISYVFQNVRRRDCRNPEALLRKIHRRSTEMIHGNEGAVLLRILALLRRVPGLFRLTRRFQSSFATAVLANVGELKRVFATRFPLRRGRVVAGNLLIQRIDGIAPLRQNTNVAVSFGSYAGELILNLRAHPSVMTSGEAERFLDQLVARLKRISQTQSLSVSAETELSSENGPSLSEYSVVGSSNN